MSDNKERAQSEYDEIFQAISNSRTLYELQKAIEAMETTSYKPTCQIKWFRKQNTEDDRPTAAIRAEYRFDDDLFCLKQLWVSDGESDQWRDIDCVY